jgi:formyl-CoA transferase
MQGVFADYLLDGLERPRIGNAGLYVYGDTFRAKDGWIFIHLGRNAIWQRFVKLIGREELNNDPRFSDDIKRAENRKLIDDIVKPWVAERTIKEIICLLDEARVPSQKVNTVAEALADPQLKARKMLVDVDYPGKGKVAIPGIVIKFSESVGKIKRRAPFLGEHNEEILVGLLGYKKEEIPKLKKIGVI